MFVGLFLFTKIICFTRQCRRIWSKPTVWQRCTESSVSLWKQNWPKSERRGMLAGNYLRYHGLMFMSVKSSYTSLIDCYMVCDDLRVSCHWYFGITKISVCRTARTKWPSVFSWWLSVMRHWRRGGPWRWRASRLTWSTSDRNLKM